MKVKKFKLLISILIIILIALIIFLIVFKHDKPELKSIKSKKELEKIYNWDYYDDDYSILTGIVSMPFTYFDYYPRYYRSYKTNSSRYVDDYVSIDSIGGININAATTNTAKSASSYESSTTKDYSTTNIQVENVDEADITKTDGDYIYSLSENNVVITDIRDPQNIKIASKINLYGCVPEDLLLCNGKLVVIFNESSSSRNYNSNTLVEIYDISDKENQKSLKSYTLYEPYYTCRCIDNNLYVISSGRLRKENNEIATYYKENSKIKEINLRNIYYFSTIKTDTQTLISKVNLDNLNEDISINSYLIDISNSYVSENSIYLLNYDYSGYNYENPPISSLFTLKGVFGPASYENNNSKDSGYNTNIYKFDILNDGTIKYKAKANTKGQTINQYSFDEYEGNLRVALYDGDGSRVVVFDNNMKQIGESDYVARGEKMYSSRFIGNKLYFVTFRTMDPLFVVDLSNPKKPEILGELKIPGYSTYLHPYDENHIIGIGMQTEETINRSYDGRVTSTSSRITGMKMALFDISDVTNPKEVSHVVIGDSKTTSAILTNPKALLFSKDKELIAIPVNNYADDFKVTYSDNIEATVSSYTNYGKTYLSEGYLVYKINLDGFNLKGVITHENNKTNSYSYYKARLLRGMYIENNLFTVSENAIKVNKLDNLEPVSELNIIESKLDKNIEGVDLYGN